MSLRLATVDIQYGTCTTNEVDDIRKRLLKFLSRDLAPKMPGANLEEINTPEMATDDSRIEADATQFEVRFTTRLPEKFQIPSDKMVIPGDLTRLDMSEIVNESLSLESRIPFDFLINSEFLRNTLAVHCSERGILSEKTVEIEYVIAMEEPVTKELNEPQKEWISGFALSGSSIITCSVDGIMTRYEKESGKQLQRSVLSDLPLTGVCCSDNGTVITVSKDGHIRFSSADSLDLIASAKISDPFRSVSLCPFDQTLVLSGSHTGAIHLWNVPMTGKKAASKKRSSPSQVEPRALVLETSSAIVSIAWLALSRAVAACEDGTIHVFDPISTEVFPIISTNRAISAMAILGSSKLVTGHPDGRIVFWEIKNEGRTINLEAINSCRSHSRMITCLDSRPGSDVLVASSSIDGCVKLFDSRASHFAVQSVSLPAQERALAVMWLGENTFVSGGSDGVVRTHAINVE